MSDITTTAPAITVDDLRHKALHIKDMAENEVRAVVTDRRTQIVTVGVIAVLAVVSLAYYLGSRRAEY